MSQKKTSTALILKKRIKSRKAAKRKKKQSLETVLGKIDQCIDVFDYKRAMTLCYKALNSDPNNEHVLETAGTVLLENGKTDEASKCFLRAVELVPNTGYVKYLQLGQLSSGEDAVKYICKGLDIMKERLTNKKGDVKDIDISNVYCSLAEVYLTDECYEDNAEQNCYECCCNAIKYGSNNPEAYQVMANYYLSRENIEEAKKLLLKSVSLWLPAISEEETEALPIETDSPSYHSRINCSKLLIEAKEYERAYQVLESLLKDDDEVLVVWYLLGWLEFLREDFSASKFYLERVVHIYDKLECDEEDMLAHSQEILQQIVSMKDKIEQNKVDK